MAGTTTTTTEPKKRAAPKADFLKDARRLREILRLFPAAKRQLLIDAALADLSDLES